MRAWHKVFQIGRQAAWMLLRIRVGIPFVAEHYEFLLCELLRQLAQTNLSPLRIHLGAQQEQARATAEEIGFEHTMTSAHIELRLDH